MREKFRVGIVSRDKRMVCVGRSEMRVRKSAAKRKYRRRVNQQLKQTDPDTADDTDILMHKQELTGWDIS